MAEANHQTRQMGNQNRKGSQAQGRSMAQSTATMDALRIAGAAIVGCTLAGIVVYIYTLLTL